MDAALERAASTSEAARREAERDRAALLDEQGADANRSEQRVEVIRKL
jgi:(E)-4-hydroxy-3-methylbut-2-enyl-diphosphate synthase